LTNIAALGRSVSVFLAGFGREPHFLQADWVLAGIFAVLVNELIGGDLNEFSSQSLPPKATSPSVATALKRRALEFRRS